MANNKVQLANGTVLIDLTDTTALASDVMQGKYFYNAAGVKTEGTATSGGSAAIVVEDTTDEYGGTTRTITAVDISNDTVAADKLLQGYTAHNSAGNAITGTYVPASTSLQTKTATPTESQ